jgi:hypothetical protein
MGLTGAIELRLAPAEGIGTSVTLPYRPGGYFPDDLSRLAPAVERVQARQLGGLATLLRGGPVEPWPRMIADARVRRPWGVSPGGAVWGATASRQVLIPGRF